METGYVRVIRPCIGVFVAEEEGSFPKITKLLEVSKRSEVRRIWCDVL